MKTKQLRQLGAGKEECYTALEPGHNGSEMKFTMTPAFASQAMKAMSETSSAVLSNAALTAVVFAMAHFVLFGPRAGCS
jgi:hypothetical protein